MTDKKNKTGGVKMSPYELAEYLYRIGDALSPIDKTSEFGKFINQVAEELILQQRQKEELMEKCQIVEEEHWINKIYEEASKYPILAYEFKKTFPQEVPLTWVMGVIETHPDAETTYQLYCEYKDKIASEWVQRIVEKDNSSKAAMSAVYLLEDYPMETDYEWVKSIIEKRKNAYAAYRLKRLYPQTTPTEWVIDLAKETGDTNVLLNVKKIQWRYIDEQE